MIKIITQQASESLPAEHPLKKYITLDPTNFNNTYKILKSIKTKEICVIDTTMSQKIKEKEIIQVMDHINNTGANILIGKQKILGIDFIDMSNFYTHKDKSIITHCCGKVLNTNKDYPSHYLCNITTLARAMKFNKIMGLLYNRNKG